MNDSSDALLLALMARLIRVESMVCSLSILIMKHMAGDKVDEYRAGQMGRCHSGSDS